MSIIKSFAVGNGDMFYINHNSDNFTIIDCCICEDNQDQIIRELTEEAKYKGIVRFISTHPDDDHIRGLAYLHEEMDLLNFYCVKNAATKPDETDDFDQYCALRDDPKRAFYISKGCSRKWMNVKDDKRGNSGIHVLWPDLSDLHFEQALLGAADGECWNNISPIVKYDIENGPTVLWMGDLETDFMESLDAIPVDRAHILFAPHHGRDSGKVPCDWLERINPKLVIIGEAPAEHLNYYADYNTITQNSAGDITLDCEAGKAHIYVSNRNYSVDFLDDERMPSTHGTYIGTLSIGRARTATA